MGVTFRSGEYLRFVRLGGRTIKDGEAAAIWNRRGEHEEVVGPRRVLLWYSTIRFLTRHKAEAHQYLRVKRRDGTVRHVRGPANVYLNPSLHDEISVVDGVQLKENEVIRVCRIPTNQNGLAEMMKSIDQGKPCMEGTISKSASAEVGRRTVRGPTLFIPGVDDIVETFEWTVLPDELGSGGTSCATFSTVALNTSHVWNVRVPIGNESGDAVVSLSITYKIESIEKVALHRDPCKSLCVALLRVVRELCAGDAVAAAASSSATSRFRSLRAGATERLSRPDSFRHLLDAAAACGFCVQDAKLVDVIPGDPLRHEMDQENHREAKSKADVEAKKRQISFRELELEEDQKRIENEDALARKAAKMRADLADEVHGQEMKALDQENELEERKDQKRLDARKASDQVVLDFLGSLKDLGVDMTKFLCSEDGKRVTSRTLEQAPSLAPLPLSES